MSWRIGDRVRHDNVPDWGLGEVVETTDDKVRVYFEHAGEKLLKGAPLSAAAGADATRALPRPRSTPGKSPTQRQYRPITAYRDAFVEQFPAGFADPAYVEQERVYKLDASTLLTSTLGPDAVQPLADAGDWQEIARRARSIVSKTNIIDRHEMMDLNDGLKTDEGQERFSRALVDLLHGLDEFDSRFERFCEALSDIDAPKWTIATYFPFLADSTTHMFLKPVATQRIALACGVELNYRSAPNVLTYRSLLRLAERLRETLGDLQPRDMIDIQSFIWLTAR